MLISVEEVKEYAGIPKHTSPCVTQFSLPENWSEEEARLLQVPSTPVGRTAPGTSRGPDVGLGREAMAVDLQQLVPACPILI